MEFTSVTIIIGATDETESLHKTVDYVMQNCDHDDIGKVLMIHSKNASQGCRNTMNELEALYPGKVFAMQQIRNGIGGAIQDGFDAANTSHIMILPSDLAIGLDCVPEMIRRAKLAPDVISKTSRWANKDSFHNYSGVRKTFNGLSQIFLGVLYGNTLTDYTNPVQTAPTEIYKSSVWKELSFPFLLEMVIVPLRRGYSFEEFAVECYGREEGRSKNSAIKTAMYLKPALRVRFTPKNKLRRG